MCTLTAAGPIQAKEEIGFESDQNPEDQPAGSSLPALTEIQKRKTLRNDKIKKIGSSTRTTPSSADSSRSGYNKCPLCKGTGYRQFPTSSSAKIVKGQRMMLQQSLPKSESHICRKGLEVFSAALDSGDKDDSLKTKISPERQVKQSSSTSLQAPSKDGKGEMSSSKSLELFPRTSEFITNVPERISRARESLKSTNWDIMMNGVEICVHVARQDAYVVLPLITSIYRALINCLRAPRVKIVRMSEQAAREMFQLTKAVSRPEFDGLVSLLLLKTADNNKSVRTDAMNALHAMVDNMALQYVCRSLTYQGPQNKNHLVRLSVLQLLERIISLVEPKVLLTQPALKDARKKFLEIVTTLVNDPHLAVRSLAKRIFKALSVEEEFEEALYADIHCDIIKKLEKQDIINLAGY